MGYVLVVLLGVIWAGTLVMAYARGRLDQADHDYWIHDSGVCECRGVRVRPVAKRMGKLKRWWLERKRKEKWHEDQCA